MSLLEHYQKCILAGLWKGEPKQKSLNEIQEIQQKPNEDASEFLERIYQAYRCYTGADPKAPENTRMVNSERLKYPEKVAKMRWYIWNEPFSFGRCCC